MRSMNRRPRYSKTHAENLAGSAQVTTEPAQYQPPCAGPPTARLLPAMLNFLRPFFQRLFRPLIQALARTPVTPNMITVVGTLGVCAPCLALFPIGETFPGAATATVFVFTDMLDGQLARIKGDSGRYGAFLDSTMDRVADACLFGGITIWFMRSDHLLAVVSLFCLACGLCVSYVKARAEGLGLKANVGLIERPERLTIALVGIGLSGLGVPYVMAIGMWAVAAGSAYTLWQRMRAVYQDAQAKADLPWPPPPPAEPAPSGPSAPSAPEPPDPGPEPELSHPVPPAAPKEA
jgi:CDP-diacylglycerol--glycerol-3-phosphate 3-phosphatidyltransferase